MTAMVTLASTPSTSLTRTTRSPGVAGATTRTLYGLPVGAPSVAPPSIDGEYGGVPPVIQMVVSVPAAMTGGLATTPGKNPASPTSV